MVLDLCLSHPPLSHRLLVWHQSRTSLCAPAEEVGTKHTHTQIIKKQNKHLSQRAHGDEFPIFTRQQQRHTALIYLLLDRSFKSKNPPGVYSGGIKHLCDHVATVEKISSGTLAVLRAAVSI